MSSCVSQMSTCQKKARKASQFQQNSCSTLTFKDDRKVYQNSKAVWLEMEEIF